MKYAEHFLILMVAIAEIGCSSENNQFEITENQSITSNEKTARLQIKYLVAIIYHKRGAYMIGGTDNPKPGFHGPIEDYTWCSEIIETTDVNETVKYRIIDEVEDEMRNRFRESIHSITKRDCMVFDTYIEASEYRRKFRK
jgi:hypothetical protein